MTRRDPIPQDDELNEMDVLMQAYSRVSELPHLAAFEQVAYDEMAERVARHIADEPIAFHPRLMRTQFPESLNDCFIYSGVFRIDDFRIVQLLRPPSLDDEQPVRQSKMAFEVNGTAYTFVTDGSVATLTAETQNGPSSKSLTDGDYTAFAASILFAMQYDPGVSTDIALEEDPLIMRREIASLDESLIERIIMTMGHLNGQAETVTTSIFDTGDDLLQANLTVRENPRMSGINNSLVLSKFTSVDPLESTLIQNEAIHPSNNLRNHYIKQMPIDFVAKSDEAKVLKPSDDFVEYAKACRSLLVHIEPLLSQYPNPDSYS